MADECIIGGVGWISSLRCAARFSILLIRWRASSLGFTTGTIVAKAWVGSDGLGREFWGSSCSLYVAVYFCWSSDIVDPDKVSECWPDEIRLASFFVAGTGVVVSSSSSLSFFAIGFDGTAREAAGNSK
jgi:hypothetical protein